MIRLLLGDDHRIVREGLKQTFADATDLVVVAEATSGAQVLEQVQALAGRSGLDVVLLDIAMPEMDGLEVLRVLHRDYPDLPVLMLSTYAESQYALPCMRLGAFGYLNKSADPDDMLLAVRELAQGRKYVTSDLAQAMAGALSSSAGAALSHREDQVFRLLTSGMSVSEIGAKLGLAPNTVSTYRARILEKKGARNDVELALLANRPSL